jgi:hypothetical protein
LEHFLHSYKPYLYTYIPTNTDTPSDKYTSYKDNPGYPIDGIFLLYTYIDKDSHSIGITIANDKIASAVVLKDINKQQKASRPGNSKVFG